MPKKAAINNGKTVCIIGGTSGIGLELGLKYRQLGYRVIITGRHDPHDRRFNYNYRRLKLNSWDEHILQWRIDRFLRGLPAVDELVLCAGFYQLGTIVQLSPRQIRTMRMVGFDSPVSIYRGLLKRQGHLGALVTITSTSAVTPRPDEPVYNFVKAGLSLFTAAQAGDEHVERVVEIQPSGTNSKFFGKGVRTADRMEPARVADHIMRALSEPLTYQRVRVNRETDDTTTLSSQATKSSPITVLYI